MSEESPQAPPQREPAAPEPAAAAPLPAPSATLDTPWATLLWSRIKEHKIAQWTLAYAAFAFAALHATTLLSDALDWPHAIVRAFTLILMVGLVMTPILAWYHGVRKLRRVSLPELALIILLLAIGAILLWRSPRPAGENHLAEVAQSASVDAARGRNAGAPAAVANSVAVLPFVDMSEKRDQEYFADGMAEEILDLLAKIPAIKVIGRTSSFQFKGKSADLRTIGATLGATYVLEGSVRKAADRIRVTAQLIDTRDGTHSWSGAYDRNFGDVLKLQDEIAAGIARALQVTMGGANDSKSQRGLRNAEAYTLYLRGRYAMDREDEAGFQEAQTDFEQALVLDPSFVPAAEQLASSLTGMVANQLVPSEIGWQRVEKAAQEVLRLDPDSATAHVLLGMRHALYEFDFNSAEAEVAKVLKLHPRDPNALGSAGRIAFIRGRYDDALRFLNAALTADPLSPYMLHTLAETHYFAGRLPAAEAATRRSLEISPTFTGNHWLLGRIFLERGQPDAALHEMEFETPDGGRDAGMAIAYHALGRHAESDRSLAQLTQQLSQLWTYGIAEVYAFRGETDDAFRWLDKAYTAREADLQFVKGDPLLRNLHADPRYQAFLQKMRLAD